MTVRPPEVPNGGVFMSAEARLIELGIVLPPAPSPVASYVTIAETGNVAYTAGHGPLRADGTMIVGRVGEDLDVDEAREAARVTALGLLATIRQHLGSLDRVTRVVKILGMVNAVPDFGEHPAVINGCSDLFVEVFGPRGVHARSAVGMGSLPGRIPVEIEVVVEFE
jgi:enamine deaminase RidA (YjgF/YER057c/UK114 family)